MSYNKVILIHPAKDSEHDKCLICKLSPHISEGTREGEGRGDIVFPGNLNPLIYSLEPSSLWQMQQQPFKIQSQSFTFQSLRILGAHWDSDNLPLLCCVSTASNSASAQKDPPCMRPISQLYGLNGKFNNLGRGAGGVEGHSMLWKPGCSPLWKGWCSGFMLLYMKNKHLVSTCFASQCVLPSWFKHPSINPPLTHHHNTEVHGGVSTPTCGWEKAPFAMRCWNTPSSQLLIESVGYSIA